MTRRIVAVAFVVGLLAAPEARAERVSVMTVQAVAAGVRESAQATVAASKATVRGAKATWRGLKWIAAHI